MCGGDWDRIEATMTIPRYREMQKEWKEHPPMQVLLEAWVTKGKGARGQGSNRLGSNGSTVGTGKPGYAADGTPIMGAKDQYFMIKAMTSTGRSLSG